MNGVRNSLGQMNIKQMEASKPSGSSWESKDASWLSVSTEESKPSTDARGGGRRSGLACDHVWVTANTEAKTCPLLPQDSISSVQNNIKQPNRARSMSWMVVDLRDFGEEGCIDGVAPPRDVRRTFLASTCILCTPLVHSPEYNVVLERACFLFRLSSGHMAAVVLGVYVLDIGQPGSSIC
ncbi:uncharacterized protein BDV17DRAFT_209306 [Aspergillus undulatus]|uniref:uncharacterized protein n=1 Tax=Aspergillus undulatus TaxID=1810928 RepID=UPI003CCE1ED8